MDRKNFCHICFYSNITLLQLLRKNSDLRFESIENQKIQNTELPFPRCCNTDGMTISIL